MTNFYTEHKKYILPAILTFVYVLFIITTWGKWGNVIADCFREMTVPQAVADGKVLYSDITCLYPPLAYQINALLFKIFGNSLNVLYLSAIACSSLVLVLLYKISQKYSSAETAFITVLTTMGIFTFRIMQLNSASWFFPYSYSFLYAFTACFAAFYLFLLFNETEDKKYLYLSGLMIGLSVAFKLDFLLFAILPFVAACKTKSIKGLLTAISVIILPFCFTLLIWLMCGGSADILSYQKEFLTAFANAPSVLQYNSLVLIQSINKYSLNLLSFSGLAFLIQIVAITIFSALVIFVAPKIKNVIFKSIFSVIAFLTGYIFIIQNIAIAHFKMDVHPNLVFLPYFLILTALAIWVIRNEQKIYSRKEKFYLLLIVSAFLMSYRIWAAVFISSIGNFIAVMYWLAFVYLLLEIIPEYFPKLQNNMYRKLVCTVLVLYAFSYSVLYLTNAGNMNEQISSDKGVIYGGKTTDTINKTIEYINANIDKDKTVLVADEGLVLNYLTDRKTNLKYYALIPHFIDTFGEENIIADLDKNPPDYIFVTNNPYLFVGYFGKNYALKIMDYILTKYDKTEDITGKNGFEISIYKLKP